MKTIYTIAICLLILLGGGFAFFLFGAFKPEATKQERPVQPRVVEVFEVQIADETIRIRSQGSVEPVTSTRLAAEITGKIVHVNPRLDVGAVFQTSEVLFGIDDADYRFALKEAQSRVADAELELKSEEARVAQAIRDWKKLGGDNPASELVRREPQLKSAQAKLEAARAAAEKALHDLDRTRVFPPYPCRIRQKHVEEGGFVIVGAALADLYSHDQFEVRLPVSVDDFAFLPAIRTSSADAGPRVDFFADIAGTEYRWQGRVLRTEGEVDRKSRSIYLVASIDAGPGRESAGAIEAIEGAETADNAPAGGGDGGDERDGVDGPAGIAASDDSGNPANTGRMSGDRFLAPGLFVNAEITGADVPGLAKIPRAGMHTRDTVLIVDKENRIEFRKVTVAREERSHVYVSRGLEAGERIVVTPLETAIGPMKVEIRKEGESENGEG